MIPFMPIGIIDESTENGGIFTLTRQEDRQTLKPGTELTVWNFHQAFETVARVRGEITEVGRTAASYVITELQIDPDWPSYVDPTGAGNPIYLAEKESFFRTPAGGPRPRMSTRCSRSSPGSMRRGPASCRSALPLPSLRSGTRTATSTTKL